MNDRIGGDLRWTANRNSYHSHQVALDAKRAVENSQNVDIVVWLYQVGNSVVTVKKNADFARTGELIFVSDLRKVLEQLGPKNDAQNSASSSVWVVDSDVIIDIPEPSLSFCGPVYLSQVFIRRSISSLLMVRPSSESLSPRWTIKSKASSRTISSYELSSGCF
jgi:hypothetical protein